MKEGLLPQLPLHRFWDLNHRKRSVFPWRCVRVVRKPLKFTKDLEILLSLHQANQLGKTKEATAVYFSKASHYYLVHVGIEVRPLTLMSSP